MSLGATMRTLVDPVLAVVFPAHCPVCSHDVERPTRGPLCEGCWAGVASGPRTRCRCGQFLAIDATSCGRCRRGLSPVSAGFSLGLYDGALRVAVHELKYRGRRRVAARLADAIVSDAAARGLLSQDVVLVPVPLHPRRKRERGFNQAELLALEVGRRLGLPVSPSALVRRAFTAAQTGLSASARRKNVAGAFAVRRRTQVDAKVVVLVDDVVTTGATARACAQALRDAGATDVRLLSAARVES